MKTQTVTVLMTVYNAEKFLKSAVDSILNQTYQDFEFLIINDASNDNSLNVLKTFHDERIHVINNPYNIGQTRSLNVGLEKAKGCFIARMDADDKGRPNWLEVMVRNMEQCPEAVVISPRACRMNMYERPMRLLNTPQDQNKILLKSLFSSPINHVGCMYHKDAILKVGGYQETYKIAADYALWCTLLRQGSMLKNIKPVLVDIRTHTKSMSMIEANKRVADEMISIYGENLPHWIKIDMDETTLKRIWRVVFYPELGLDEEFKKSVALYLGVYKSLGENAIFYGLKEVIKMYVKRTMGKRNNV